MVRIKKRADGDLSLVSARFGNSRRLESLLSIPRHLCQGEYRAMNAVMSSAERVDTLFQCISFFPYTQCGMLMHNVSGPSGLRPGGCSAIALVDALISGKLSCLEALRAKVASDLHGRQTFLMEEKPVLWQNVIVLFPGFGDLRFDCCVMRSAKNESAERGTVWSIRAQATVRKLNLMHNAQCIINHVQAYASHNT